MSFQLISSPRTVNGITLGETLGLITPQFLIHECGYSPSVEDWNSGDIMSPFWCLWHILDDGCWVESHGKRWDLGANSLMLAPAQVIYATFGVRPTPQVWIHFSLLPDYAFEAAAPFKMLIDPSLHEQLKALIKACTVADLVNEPALYHHCAALLNSCFARHPLPARVLPDDLRKVLKYVESSLADDVSNTRLARLVNLSVSSFINLFSLHMHQSPAAYVRAMRYQQASRMLIFSDLTIEEIAEALGYPNRDYFSRAFALRAGCGPATFRKQRRK